MIYERVLWTKKEGEKVEWIIEKIEDEKSCKKGKGLN